jgi:ribonuclease BN (tRNA processing enzyme)
MMRVIILGSGTCVPSLKRSSSSILIDIDGVKLLMDSGAGTIRRLLETQTRIFDISYIFYSHFHPDHSGELASFLFSTKYSGKHLRKKPLTIVAAKGFNAFYDRLKTAYGKWIELEPHELTMVDLDNSALALKQFNGFSVASTPVEHNEESLAYKIIDADGKSVVYSGDTDYSDGLIELAENADILICESSLPDGLKVDGHLTPSLAGTIASRAHVKKLVLNHFYPECDTYDMIGQCRTTYAGPLVLAEDLMRIDV